MTARREFIAAGNQTIGARERQEDHFHVRQIPSEDGEGIALCVLADGMGGHVGGSVASRIAVEVFTQQFLDNRSLELRGRLRLALDAANSAIATRVEEEPDLKGMGCTLIGAWKRGRRFSWVSVGDSPMWCYRGSRLKRLNADHSVAGRLKEMAAKGEIASEEISEHPQKNALRSALMGGEIRLIDLQQIELDPGDRIVMASDGIETLSDGEIRRCLREYAGAGPADMANILLEEVDARQAKRQDNTSVIVLDHRGTGQHTLGPLERLLPAGLPTRQIVLAGGAVVVGALLLYAALSLLGGGGEAPPEGETATIPNATETAANPDPDGATANTDPAPEAEDSDKIQNPNNVDGSGGDPNANGAETDTGDGDQSIVDDPQDATVTPSDTGENAAPDAQEAPPPVDQGNDDEQTVVPGLSNDDVNQHVITDTNGGAISADPGIRERTEEAIQSADEDQTPPAQDGDIPDN